MNSNTDHLKRIPYFALGKRNGPVQAFGIGDLVQGKTGRFHSTSDLRKNGTGTHDHNWIFGDENAVCTKCGYLLPKSVKPPQRGIYSASEIYARDEAK